MFQDWEHLSNLLGPGIHQRCFKNGQTQQGNNTGYTSAMFHDWEHLSKVIGRSIHQQCFRIGE